MKHSYSFRHIAENLYEIDLYGSVWLVVRAYGASAIVVDKHRTARVSKRTTNIDRFDLNVAAEDLEYFSKWIEQEGSQRSTCVRLLCDILDDIAEHHTYYIARLITE